MGGAHGTEPQARHGPEGHGSGQEFRVEKVDSRPGWPRLIRAGRHIARPKRYLRNYGAEVEPDELVAEVERQAARGDGWVKLVGDWIDRDAGDLAPLWPADAARAAIERAHQLGARVTVVDANPAALAGLPEPEREAWRRFWNEVAGLLTGTPPKD